MSEVRWDESNGTSSNPIENLDFAMFQEDVVLSPRRMEAIKKRQHITEMRRRAEERQELKKLLSEYDF